MLTTMKKIMNDAVSNSGQRDDDLMRPEVLKHLVEHKSRNRCQYRPLVFEFVAALQRGGCRLLDHAARFNFTYYGQLAATRGGRSATLSLPQTERVSDEARNRARLGRR